MTRSPENVVVVVKKQRGSVVAVWDIFGALFAALMWPALLVAAHVVRFARDRRKRSLLLNRA